MPGAYSHLEIAREMAHAVADNNEDNMRFFAAEGANLDYHEGVGLTYLQNAANDGRLSTLKLLLELGAKPDVTGGGSGWTALHYAAYRCNELVTAALLEHGANPNTPGNGKELPLHTAVHAGSMEVVTLLVEAGADIAARNERGHTASAIARFRAAEHLQFAQRPFEEIACYLDARQEAMDAAAAAVIAQREKVEGDLAALHSFDAKRVKLKL